MTHVVLGVHGDLSEVRRSATGIAGAVFGTAGTSTTIPVGSPWGATAQSGSFRKAAEGRYGSEPQFAGQCGVDGALTEVALHVSAEGEGWFAPVARPC